MSSTVLSPPTPTPSTNLYSSPAPATPSIPTPTPTSSQPPQLSPDEERKRRGLVRDYEGLSSLCSQFHTSEYSRLKWGAAGAPVYYVPLSVQLPEHVSQVMHRQATVERAVYPPPSPPSLAAGASASTASSTSGPDARSRPPPTSTTTKSVSAKFPTMLPDPPPPHQARPPAKSPSTALLEAHIRLASLSPPSGRGLTEEEGLEGVAVGLADPSSAGEGEVKREPVEGPTQTCGRETSGTGGGVEARVKEALEDALDRPAQTVSLPPASPAARQEVFASIEAGRQRPPGVGIVGQTAQLVGAPGGGAGGMKTSDSHPINISILLPPSSLPLLAPLLTHPVASPPIPLILPSLLSLPLLALSSSPTDVYTPSPPPTAHGQPTAVGNFLMSSCPGKKVRLSGGAQAVKGGRGAICRDLEADLRRIRALGVGAVICCLDDAELSYLGSPIQRYATLCASLSLSLIRIPMPEGLHPSSLALFDGQVEHVVREFTLKGISVLAHCRGGVGRAGVVACAWAVKMGLVPPPSSLSTSPSTSASMVAPSSAAEGEASELLSFGHSHGTYAPADLQIAKDAIGLVRRRRSVKAIETYEQVRFVLDYVRWVREGREKVERTTV